MGWQTAPDLRWSNVSPVRVRAWSTSVILSLACQVLVVISARRGLVPARPRGLQGTQSSLAPRPSVWLPSRRAVRRSPLRASPARVHNAAAGQRNACLYIASVALGQLVAGGALPEPDARTVLLSAAGRHVALGAYSPAQAEKTITSGLHAGARRPRRIGEAA